MSYSLVSIDRYEMWGPGDTIERLYYKGKYADQGWNCKEREDYIRVNWIVEKLNERNISLKDLDQTIKSLERSYLNVRHVIERKYWEELIKKETCPSRIRDYEQNMVNIKRDIAYEKNKKKFDIWKIKTIDQIGYDFNFMSGYIKDNKKRTYTKKQISLYNKLKEPMGLKDIAY